MFSYHAGMNWDSKAKGGIVDIYKDYNELQFMLISYIFVESKKRQRKKNWVKNL